MGAIIIVSALAIGERWTNRARRANDMAVLECSGLYADAPTLTDTLAVDAVHPAQRPRAYPTRVTCGVLREDGLLD